MGIIYAAKVFTRDRRLAVAERSDTYVNVTATLVSHKNDMTRLDPQLLSHRSILFFWSLERLPENFAAIYASNLIHAL